MFPLECQARPWQQGCDVSREEGGLRSLDPGVTQRQIYYKCRPVKENVRSRPDYLQISREYSAPVCAPGCWGWGWTHTPGGAGAGAQLCCYLQPGPTPELAFRIKLQTRKRASSRGRGNLISGRVNTQIRQGCEWRLGQAPSVPPPVIRERVLPAEWHRVQRPKVICFMAIYGHEGCGDDDGSEEQFSRLLFIFCKTFAERGCDYYSKVAKWRLISWGWFWPRAPVSSAWSPTRAPVTAPLTITRHTWSTQPFTFLLFGWRESGCHSENILSKFLALQIKRLLFLYFLF